jgi:hypothetical protein
MPRSKHMWFNIFYIYRHIYKLESDPNLYKTKSLIIFETPQILVEMSKFSFPKLYIFHTYLSQIFCYVERKTSDFIVRWWNIILQAHCGLHIFHETEHHANESAVRTTIHVRYLYDPFSAPWDASAINTFTAWLMRRTGIGHNSSYV